MKIFLKATFFITIIALISHCNINYAFSKTLIISDIDDTIKTSHVRKKLDVVRYAFYTRNSFYGMNELYKLLLKNIKNTELFYVTNALDFISKKPNDKFLLNADFPKADVLYKDKKNHKVYAISNLINKAYPKLVILIGDNGEQDINYYREISKSFKDKDIRFMEFIRIAYIPDKDDILDIKEGQIPFVTPVEIALTLADENIMEFDIINNFIEKIADKIINEERKPDNKTPQTFPKWINCEKFTWRKSWDKYENSIRKLQKVKEKLASRCREE